MKAIDMLLESDGGADGTVGKDERGNSCQALCDFLEEALIKPQKQKNSSFALNSENTREKGKRCT